MTGDLGMWSLLRWQSSLNLKTIQQNTKSRGRGDSLTQRRHQISERDHGQLRKRRKRVNIIKWSERKTPEFFVLVLFPCSLPMFSSWSSTSFYNSSFRLLLWVILSSDTISPAFGSLLHFHQPSTWLSTKIREVHSLHLGRVGKGQEK
jgi:hypothetical protein